MTTILFGDGHNALRFLTWWRRAVEQQAERLEASTHEDDRTSEFLLYAVALDTLFEAARHIDSLTSGSLALELAAFRRSVPSYDDIRDVIMHFAAYEQGKGKLQHRSVDVQRQTGAYPVVYNDEFGLSLGLHGGQHELNLQSSLEEAKALAAAAYDAVMTLAWNTGELAPGPIVSLPEHRRVHDTQQEDTQQ